jgi:hypothetical protein
MQSEVRTDHPEVIASRLVRAWPVALVLACALVSGCGGDASAPSRPLAVSVVTGDGQTVEVGRAFAQPVAFKVTDASGTGVKGVSVSFSVSSGTATVSPTATTTDAQGLAATTVTAGPVAGEIVITARATGTTHAANATLTAQLGIAKLVGQWSGTTAQNLPVRMRINAAGSIDSLTVRLTATFGLSTCTGTVVRTGVPINADSTFETTVGIGFPTSMRGRFTTATTVSGTIDGYSGAFGIVCGAMVMIGTGSPWSNIQWQGQRQ